MGSITLKLKQRESRINTPRNNVKEILPPGLRKKSDRLAFIKAKVNEPQTLEEKRLEVKAINKECRVDVWHWTNALDKAAFYVAEGRLSLTEIKAKTGVSPGKIKRMVAREGEFFSRVQHYREQWYKRFVSHSYGNRQTRLLVLEELSDKMREIIHARQEKYSKRKHPGVSTGMMVRTVKAVGHGASTKIVRGWDFDKDLIHELRETQIHIAKERGEWAERNINENTVLVREYEGADPKDV